MGALDEGHFKAEIENEVQICCHGGESMELGFEEEAETVAIKEAVKTLLHGLSEDVNREGIKKTPLRVAKALRHGTRGYKQKVKDIVQGALFPEVGPDNAVVGQAGGVGGLVVVRDLDHFSYCQSCLLPFQVKFHVGYIPSARRVVGLSKLSRVADVFAKRLQEPQRLADEACSALYRSIKPAGVAVVLQCQHLHFPTLDSAFPHKGWVKSVVCSGSGVFEDGDEDSEPWVDFLSLLKLGGITQRPSDLSWCPFSSKSEPAVDQAMAAAAASIIRSLGEDPSRKELAGTPARFVNWLTSFRNAELEMKLNGFVFGRTTTTTDSLNREQVWSELNLPFWSQCEHHLLPFHGVVHVGYMGPEGPLDPIGTALLQSVVHFYGFKLQVQERLTRQIAETVSSFLGGDVIVVVEASHTCMISRGIEKFGSNTATMAVLGRFSTNTAARAKFLRGIPNTTSSD